VFPDTSSPELASASASERALAERVSSYWVNFARAGDPNGNGLPRWPAFPVINVGSAAPLIIGEIKEAPDPQRLAIYDKLYAKILADINSRAVSLRLPSSHAGTPATSNGDPGNK